MNQKYSSKCFVAALLFCLPLLAMSCSSDQHYLADRTNGPAPSMAPAEKNTFGFTSDMEFEGHDDASIVSADVSKEQEPADVVATDTPSKKKRKVIYNSTLAINVDTFDGVDTKINQLVAKYDGFVASADLDHLQGEQRNGNWKVRVPVESYQSFMNTVAGIGTVVQRNEEASDVTAEFYDLEARIKNKVRLEERIVELLAEAKGNLSRLIEVERELARVREEIERMQGRKRLMMDVTSLTTISIFVQEIETYQPTPASAFGDRVDTAWTSAVTQATETGENLVVKFVRNAINVAVAIVGLIFVWLVYRIFFRKRQTTTTTTSTTS